MKARIHLETLHALCHKGLMDEEGRTLIRTNISDLGMKVALANLFLQH